MSEAVGKPLNRVDGRLKVTGGAQYPSEISIENIAHAVLIQSTITKGRIRAIDLSMAERVPGVLGIITHLNAPKLTTRGEGFPPQVPLLQDDVVQYNGQHVGVVIAENLEQAAYAASLVKVDYAVERAATDFKRELSRAISPEAGPGGLPDSVRGDVAQGLATADVRIDQTYTTPNEHHNPLGLTAVTAVWEGERLIIYDTTQGVHSVRRALAGTLGIPIENIQVIARFVGGAFGATLLPQPHVTIAAVASRQVQRPVKLVLTREQMYTSHGYRPQTSQYLTLGATAEGRLTGIVHEATADTSQLQDRSERITSATQMLYQCSNVTTIRRLVRLNKGTPTPMRAPGEATGIFALECAMDELAYALQLDPIELRLRNYADADPENGLPWSSKALRECYESGAQRFGWEQRNPEPGSMRDGRYLIGWGMASSTYPYLGNSASARAKILLDGSALVQSGATDIGPGTYTAMTQIAADALGLAAEQVRFELGDTNLPDAPSQGGSRIVISVGPAVQGAATAVRNQIIQQAISDRASPLYGANAQDIEVENGRLFVGQGSTRGETYADILARQGLPEVEATFDFNPGESEQFSKHAFGAQFAEVRVDLDLREVRVSRFVGVYGAGRIVNPKAARSQMISGIVGGIGMALMEETRMDHRYGRYTNANIAEYLIPTHADIPDIDVIFVDEDDPHVNPLGAKGIGEVCLVGVAPAIANAVYHATGKRIRELPITPDKLL
ncbi:xanthine dehydrogenase family protein molybdopterin-binding subunit [Pseudanabaena sp. FACHB-2040]|uniref:xanthine dehydrogenase family protein molybdopterin-binding subunit n=1 Tax=Pseudanabaena sp. FACHB-2040 TaxID=2692859 RepID=UPI0016886A3B|nr:xanthine dehydrogenase family protein molybdopterin-binding subunit [Pseudanabaena sp. FACHB-2040]MBD2261175.1 xanthine dehydrogenase family protein molybdopterin-binding subunit [Pseudanabaena sp. FACHB-2040]